MKKHKQYTIKKVIENRDEIERFTGDSILTDIYGNKIDILEATAQADSDIERLQSANVHFRWSLKEIERAKRIATIKGLKYQAYIKSVLKQQMDIDEMLIYKSTFGNKYIEAKAYPDIYKKFPSSSYKIITKFSESPDEDSLNIIKKIIKK